MRELPEGLLENGYGSLSDGYLEFTCWYNGMPVLEDLPHSGWSQTFSGGEQVSGSTKVTIPDASGELAPWGVDEPLGVGGSLLQTRLILDSAAVQLGWQRITDSATTEVWRTSKDGDLWIPGGAEITVDANDLTVMVAGAKFVSPESPLTGATCISEIRRLLLGIMDVTITEDVQDIIIPPTLTYKDERMDAVEDLISAMGCSYRVTGTGQLEVYKPNKVSVWTVKGGQFNSTLINVTRSQNISNLKNLIVARATLQGGEELQAAEAMTNGPLATTGPHGIWPDFVTADFALNQFDMQEAAHNALEANMASLSVDIPLTTVFHPGLELGDWITVMIPLTTGKEYPLPGRVTSISYSGNRIPTSMGITLKAELVDVQKLSYALKAQRWN